MLPAEEDLLVMAAQRGNQQAFRILFKHYQQALLRFAYKLSADQDIANEATQQCWITSAKNLHKLRDPRAFKSWLYRLTRWRTLDLLRQQQRNDELHQQDINDVDIETLTDSQSMTSDNTDTSSLIEAIERLPAIEKQIVHLFYLDDLSLAEISIVVDIPTGTVKSRLNRARHLLKQKYRSEDDEY